LKKILFLITGLNVGGAENVLFRFLTKIDRKKYKVKVISLIELGPIAYKINDLDIEVVSIKMKSIFSLPKSIFLFLKKTKEFNPDLIHAFMTHAALISSLASIFHKRSVIVWNIFCNDLSLRANSFLTTIMMKICSFLSYKVPKKIIVDSKSAFTAHKNAGYASIKMNIVNNGVDTEYFKPNKSLDKKYKEKFFKTDDFIIGMIARYHPVKAHDIFLKAASIVTKEKKNIKFLLNGQGVENNKNITEIIKEEQIEEFVHLSNDNLNIKTVLPICDLLISPSHFESFPNIICEAMAFEIPCIVTNVGDCKLIVGEYGRVVNPNNPQKIAEAIKIMVSLPSERLIKTGKMARKRIIDNFSIDLMHKKYEKIYKELGI
tara:strand:- start:5198 stop:6322 length:1125 start_codon:yes stop_codon:yes gene_type:complete